MGAVYVACESGAMRRIRAHLLTDKTINREHLVTRGYWKLGVRRLSRRRLRAGPAGTKTLTPIVLTALAPVSLAFAQAEIKSVPMPPAAGLPSSVQPSTEALAWSQKNLAGWPDKGAVGIGFSGFYRSRQQTLMVSAQLLHKALCRSGVKRNSSYYHQKDTIG